MHRPRPMVDQPLVHEAGASFPSGHAQAAVAGYGILLLVFLSVLRGLWRRAAIAVALMMVIGIGFSRVALAAHFVSDVIVGFVLGGAWLAATTALFSAWRVERGRPKVQPTSRPSHRPGHKAGPHQPGPASPCPGCGIGAQRVLGRGGEPSLDGCSRPY